MGDGPIPMQYGNSWLVPLRISGTGSAARPAIGEIVWRETAVWLSPQMQRRCTGLPIVIGHPEGGILDALSFRDTVVGIVTLPFVRGAELWAIGRFFDREIAEQISEPDGIYSVDTSPTVLFAAGETVRLTLDDGAVLLVEGVPGLVDHLAIVVTERGRAGGVWSRGGPTTGVGKSQEIANV